MLERLRTLLTGFILPQQLQLLLDAVEALMSNGDLELEFSIDQELSKSNLDTSELYLYLIEHCLVPAFRTHLSAMGIEMDDETPLPIWTAVFSNVMRIENFDEPTILNGLATCEESNEDVFAEILAVVSAQPSDTFIPHIASVSDALIERIAAVTDGYEEPIPVNAADYARAKQRVSQFMRYVTQNQPNVLNQPVFLDQVKMGGNADAMLASLRDTVETYPPKTAALLIILFVLASDALDTSVVAAVKREVELTFEDLVQAMQVGKLARQFLKEVGYDEV